MTEALFSTRMVDDTLVFLDPARDMLPVAVLHRDGDFLWARVEDESDEESEARQDEWGERIVKAYGSMEMFIYASLDALNLALGSPLREWRSTTQES